MKEGKFRDLIKRGTVETSDGFTDKLMGRLEAEKMVHKSHSWKFSPMFTILVLIILIISFASYKVLKTGADLSVIGLEVGRVPFFTIGTVAAFLVLNYIIKLNDTHNSSKSNGSVLGMEP